MCVQLFTAFEVLSGFKVMYLPWLVMAAITMDMKCGKFLFVLIIINIQ